VTQSQGNRNLSKSLPKRFGFADLAIDSLKSQEGAVANRFKLEHFVDKKCAATCFYGGAAVISVSNSRKPSLCLALV
jgi:hypothetical protein